MSKHEKDRLFPHPLRAISDERLAKIVAKSLRTDFGDSSSAIKRIGQLTGANLRAIKNWYDAKHAPSSGHLLLLARSSPGILEFILRQIGGEDLYDAFQLLSSSQRTVRVSSEGSIQGHVPVSNVPLNVPIKSMNERQKWFLISLKSNHFADADDIANQFKTSVKTARRDIYELKQKGKIVYHGSKKTGYYMVLGQVRPEA